MKRAKQTNKNKNKNKFQVIACVNKSLILLVICPTKKILKLDYCQYVYDRTACFYSE